MNAPNHDPETHQRRQEIMRHYLDFLDDSMDKRIYTDKVNLMLREGNTRLIVDMHHIQINMPERANALVTNFVEEIVCFEEALRQFVDSNDPDWARDHSREDLFVGFEGALGDRHVNPRTLKSRFLGQLVCVEGIVTKCSLVRPKVVKSVHYCPATDKTIERTYGDLTSYEQTSRSTIYPKEDENKNPLETEFGLSKYKDHQTFTIQELPESAPAGQLPRSLEVVADFDLADACKPGDRVRVFGLFRCLPGKQMGYTNGTFRTITIANNIQLVSKEQAGVDLEAEDVRRIKEFNRKYKEKTFNVLARSLAPSIHGHDEVKQAILCLLLGGTEKILPNGTRLRGDINVMLIGDPSVAKSQLLRYVLAAAPRALATTGRGSSGVGLTAAVTSDEETGEKRLEAGAMVLADRGVVCIDEFDKMTDVDRTAIHEVMEQGRVTIAKAGIHAKLNARCSVLAAANPVYGRYDVYKSPMENIGMQDSLLSRFDCLFVLLDQHDQEKDMKIAEHVIQLHMYRAPGEQDGQVQGQLSGIDMFDAANYDQEEQAWRKRLARQHFDDNNIWARHDGWMGKAAGAGKRKFLSERFMKKYIQLARSLKPVLTSDATIYISEKYADLRRDDTIRNNHERTMPVTARQLETLIRLSTAIAKARLSNKIEMNDAKEAYNLLHFACFKEKTKERQEQDGHYNKTGDDDEDEIMPSQTTARTKRQRENSVDQEAALQQRTQVDEPVEQDIPAAKRMRDEAAAISADRYKLFKKHVRVLNDEYQAIEPDGVGMLKKDIETKLATRLGSNAFKEGELVAAWERMTSENACMFDDDNHVLFI